MEIQKEVVLDTEDTMTIQIKHDYFYNVNSKLEIIDTNDSKGIVIFLDGMELGSIFYDGSSYATIKGGWTK